jgi:hypothetical protein
MLGFPLQCSEWQAKLLMRKVDKDKNGVADID